MIEAAVHLNLTCLALLSLFAILKGYTINDIVSTSIGLSLFCFLCIIIIYHCVIKMRGKKWFRFKSKRMLSDEPLETDPSSITHSVVELPTSGGPYTYNYYFEETAPPEPKPVPRARDEIIVTVSSESDKDSTTALIPRNSNLEPPTSTLIALEDHSIEEDTEAEELIRNNQVIPENVKIDVSESKVENSEAKLSINSKNTSYTSIGDSQQEICTVQANPLAIVHEPLSSEEQNSYNFKTNRQSRREFYSYRSTRNFDSDTDATGQKPSRAITKCHLVRLIDPLELGIVDEGDSDSDELVTQPKVYKFKSKSAKKSKQEAIMGQWQESKSVAIDMSQFENEFDENIPLLSLDVTTCTDLNKKVKRKQSDHPLISFEEAQNDTTSTDVSAKFERKRPVMDYPLIPFENEDITASTHFSTELEKTQLHLPFECMHLFGH